MKTQQQIKLTGRVIGMPMRSFLVEQTLKCVKTQTRRLMKAHKSRYQPGDLVYIQEKHLIWSGKNREVIVEYYNEDEDMIKHKVTEKTWNKILNRKKQTAWRPGRFMFKDLTRVVVLIEDIRPERLSDISGDDAIKEGIELIGGKIDDSPVFKNYHPGARNDYKKGDGYGYPVNSFKSLIESIHPGLDFYNTWVWRIRYRVVWQGSSWLMHEKDVLALLKIELGA